MIRRLKSKWLLPSLLLAVYPVCVLSYVWYHCLLSDFEGGKNGQLDAYRHALASAVVTYTSSPKLVAVATAVMERKGKPASLMDRHNNLIGVSIGETATSFNQINALVLQRVNEGTENAIEDSQVTWLARPYWEKSLFW
ncbi:MAG TPA: hypothetical protein VLA25_01185 [Methylotenera sp.]|nr:hypothetical protein [Methylotenera sp.]